MVTSLELRAREKALKEEQRRRDEKVRQQKEKERIALEARRAREVHVVAACISCPWSCASYHSC
jgi:hypothetical protein